MAFSIQLPHTGGKSWLTQLGDFRESLAAISRGKNPRRFYSELYALSRDMERAGKGTIAHQFYQLLSSREDVSEPVRIEARNRIRVLEGKGDFFEQMGMFGEHFGEVIFDKPMLVGMGLTPIGSGLGRIGGLKWAKAWGQFGIRKQALKHLVGFGGEVVAFTGGVSAMRMMMGEEVTASGYLRELKGAIYLFGGMHVMKGLGFLGHGRLFRKNPQGYLANLTRPVVGQLGMGAGIGLGNYLHMDKNLLEDLGWEGLAGRSAAEWVQYNIAGLAARGTVGRIFKPWEKRLEAEIEAEEMNMGKERPKSIEAFISPEKVVSELRRLLPTGRVTPDLLVEEGMVQQILSQFQVSDHPFDVAAFRRGYQLAERSPKFVQEIAWDVDETLLHWAFSLRDLSLSRIRQDIQLHPGIFAYLLGLRLGQPKNLVMVTTGYDTRLVKLAEGSPAFKMVFFGKLPHEALTLEEIQSRKSIYVREDLVSGMKQVLEGQIVYPFDPFVRDYIQTVQSNPDDGAKLKHPALATLRGKRTFKVLIDDSSRTFRMLGNLKDFVVLKPPSARPRRTLNFALSSKGRYLNRMVNGYVTELAKALESLDPIRSQSLPEGVAVPKNYPLQRFVIEIPWERLRDEFIRPGSELRRLGRQFYDLRLPVPEDIPRTQQALNLKDPQIHQITQRLQSELEAMTEGTGTRVSVQALRTGSLKFIALRSSWEFQEYLDRYLTKEEQIHLGIPGKTFFKQGENFYGRLAGIIAAKRGVAELLGLDPDQHAHEIRFRYGRPQLSGEAEKYLGGRNLMTTQAKDGNLGVGIAVLERAVWESGLAAIGLDLTTPRGKQIRRLGVTHEQHALAEAAYKATYRFHPTRQFSHHRYGEIQSLGPDKYLLTGKTAGAARGWHGELSHEDPLPVHGRTFSIGLGTVALVMVPAPKLSSPANLFSTPQPHVERNKAKPLPYIKFGDGEFILPKPNQTVTVLGDLLGERTFRLAAQGHRVIHIDRDPKTIGWAQNRVTRDAKRAREAKRIQRSLAVDWVNGDWYQTKSHADYVEAYFPLNVDEIPSREFPEYLPTLRKFMTEALESKLATSGRGIFLISEHVRLIRDFAQLIEADPGRELLEKGRGNKTMPLIGGNGADGPPSSEVAWLVYRPK